MHIFCNVDLKTQLGKKRRDERTAHLQPLTRMQHVHVGRLIEKYDDDYEVHYFISVRVIMDDVCFLILVVSLFFLST